jgi:GABA(A) receptor-associated protein
MLNYSFKYQVSFQDRLVESKRIIAKYPDRKPIICEKASNQIDLPTIDKRKYLVPNDLTIGQFLYVIRKRMRLTSDQALCLFVNNKLVSSSEHIGQVYHQEKDDDGFLYVKYSKENVFG